MAANLGNAVEGVGGIFSNALAANRAHDINEKAKEVEEAKNGKVHGILYKVGDAIGDFTMDTANVLTLGIARKVGNLIDDKDSKIDYKALKAASKSGELAKDAKVGDRAQYLLNDAVSGVNNYNPAARGADWDEMKTQIGDGVRQNIAADAGFELE